MLLKNEKERDVYMPNDENKQKLVRSKMKK